jgi:hypothetical protein
VSVNPQLDRPGGVGVGVGEGEGGRDLAEWRSCVCGSPAWQALVAQACGVDIVQACAGLEGTAQWNRDCACVYFRCGSSCGHVPAKQRSCRPVQALGSWPSGMEIVRVCISGMAGHEGVAWQSRDCAGLCRPGGHGLAEIVNVCGSLAFRACPREIL